MKVWSAYGSLYYLVFGEIEYLSIDNCLTKKQFETFSFQFTPITQISYVRKAVKHQTIKLGSWCVDSNVPSGNKMTVHNRNSCYPRPLFSNVAYFHIIISSFRSILFSPAWRTQKTLIIIIVFWNPIWLKLFFLWPFVLIFLSLYRPFINWNIMCKVQ